MKLLAERMRASPLVQAWKFIKIFGLAWFVMAVMTLREALPLLCFWVSLLLAGASASCAAHCCAGLSMGNLELMCPGRTNYCLFGSYGKHLLSLPLNLVFIGEVFLESVAFYSDFRLGGEGSSNLVGVGFQPRGMVLSHYPCQNVSSNCYCFTPNLRDDRGRKASES